MQCIGGTFYTEEPKCNQGNPASDPVPIPNLEGINNPGEVNVTLEVTEQGKTVCNLHVGVQIEKAYIGDLVIKITSPSGKSVTMMQQPGCNVTPPVYLLPGVCQGCPGLPTGFDLNGGPVFFGDAPIGTDGSLLADEGECTTGSLGGPDPFYLPLEPLSKFNGEDPKGNWTLTVRDYYNGDFGNPAFSDPLGLLSPCFLITDKGEL